ncbi:MAG: hypothetical protein P8010_27200, partial [Desulfosarcinaceae bacterium]
VANAATIIMSNPIAIVSILRTKKVAMGEARLHLTVPAEILILMAIQGCRDKESPWLIIEI